MILKNNMKDLKIYFPRIHFSVKCYIVKFQEFCDLSEQNLSNCSPISAQELKNGVPSTSKKPKKSRKKETNLLPDSSNSSSQSISVSEQASVEEPLISPALGKSFEQLSIIEPF